MLKLILLGSVLHLFFLASIFVIYFQSPIITGLRPQNKITNPPAKRLVLFVADGLRAESFFRQGCTNVKFLRNIILTEGIHGISHTRVPTESRTDHVALIAGMYEDPSALFKGWQENPFDFDSVFNRSKTTYAWGSPDILTIFQKKSNKYKNIKAFAYDPSKEDFSGRYSTILLETWVFDNVEQFLKDYRRQLQMENETIYFLHLLGLDTAGHVHKRNTRLFVDNVIAVDQGIERITKLFNDVFQDDRTAFIFTADHGMTDRGSHGDGDAYETETPIVAWGAGVSKYKSMNTSEKLVSIIGSTMVPRFDIKQVDIAPLMSSLLGIPVPVNNYGQLPHEYLNTSKAYIATAMFRNALQISEQYKHLRNEFSKGSFSKYLNDYNIFNGNNMSSSEIQINQLLDAGQYDEVIILSQRLINQSLDGVEYFQSYYQYWLLAAVALSMIGWILYLVQTPLRSSVKSRHFNIEISKVHCFIGTFGVFIILSFMYFQNLSIFNAFIFCMPLICWLPVSFSSILTVVKNINVWIFILAVESLLLTFFYRPILCILLVFLPIFFFISNGKNRTFFTNNTKWIVTSVVLSVFPMLPIVGKNDKNSSEILIFGIVLWLMKLAYSLQQKYTIYKMCHLVLFSLASISLIITEFTIGLNIICQIISWMCLFISFTLPLLQSTRHRFTKIIDGLSIPFLMLSLSYEPIFLLILSLNLEYFVEMHSKKANQTNDFINPPQRQEMNTYSNAFIFLLYVLLSFFGTGNLASISSFDPNSVRCFVAIFSPIIMALLIVLKIVIPLILVVCAFTAIFTSYKLSMEKIFISILVICNIMGINFLFLVTNKGSWLEIGTSISHFVIIETTTVVICILQILAKYLMTGEIHFPISKMNLSNHKFE